MAPGRRLQIRGSGKVGRLNAGESGVGKVCSLGPFVVACTDGTAFLSIGNQNKLFVSCLVIRGWQVSLNRGIGYFHEHYPVPYIKVVAVSTKT